MRLLQVKEVQRVKQEQEDEMRERLSILAEELHKRERVLNATMESIDADKQKAIKEFDEFRAKNIEKKRELEQEVRSLEHLKEVLEIETTRERAGKRVLEELENNLLAKKQEVESSLKERSGKLSKKEKQLLDEIQEYTLQLELVNERAVSQDEREKAIQDQKQEIKEAQEKLQEQTEEQERVYQSKLDDLGDKLREIEAKRSSNDLVKAQLKEAWKELETERLAFLQEKNSVKDQFIEIQGQQQVLKLEEERQERAKGRLNKEWERFELDNLSLKEKQETAKRSEEKLKRDIQSFRAKVSANRLEKDQLEKGWKEYAKAKKHLEDERATLQRAWNELNRKLNGTG